MKDLHILDWSGGKRKVQFIGWNKTHTSCFIYDEQHARRAVNLSLPSLFNLQFPEHPFPNLPPTEIVRTALHVPPCCASKDEANALQTSGTAEDAVANAFFPWKLATRHILCLQPQDYKPLARLLREELKRLRDERRADKRDLPRWVDQKGARGRHRIAELRDRCKALPRDQSAVAKSRLAKTQGKFLQWLRKLEAEQRRILEGKFTALDPDNTLISVFDVTLDMVKQGWGGLRERLLHAEWAKLSGLALDRVTADAGAFRQWLSRERAFNTRERIFDSTTRTSEVSVGLHLSETEWEILEATVSYEIRFSDGSRCWLDAIEERPLADAAEVAEFEVVQKAQAPASPHPWHSEGFGTIWRRNAQGVVSESLPLSNEFRALCQLLAERDDQTAQFSEIEPQIGTRTHHLDTEAGQGAKASSKGERRVRDLLRTETGTRLLEWGVLTEIEVGREKFLKLSPPKAAE